MRKAVSSQAVKEAWHSWRKSSSTRHGLAADKPITDSILLLASDLALYRYDSDDCCSSNLYYYHNYAHSVSKDLVGSEKKLWSITYVKNNLFSGSTIYFCFITVMIILLEKILVTCMLLVRNNDTDYENSNTGCT